MNKGQARIPNHRNLVFIIQSLIKSVDRFFLSTLKDNSGNYYFNLGRLAESGTFDLLGWELIVPLQVELQGGSPDGVSRSGRLPQRGLAKRTPLNRFIQP